jgi:hypothetical protein
LAVPLIATAGGLRRRRPAIEKLGNGGDKLCRGERFCQKDTVGNALCRPLIGMCSGDVDDWKIRVDLSGLPGDFPSIHLAPELDIRHQRAVRVRHSFEQGDGLFTRRRNSRFKAAISESVFNDDLNWHVVFNNKNE